MIFLGMQEYKRGVSPVTVSISMELSRIRHTQGDNDVGKESYLVPRSRGVDRVWLTTFPCGQVPPFTHIGAYSLMTF